MAQPAPPIDGRPRRRYAAAPVQSLTATEPRLGLIRDVGDELLWTFSGRKGWLLGIAANLAMGLAYMGLTRYDPHKAGDLKVANLGVAVTLYVLADVVTTNQLGSDGERVIASLQRGDSVPRILAIKNLSLAVLLIPFAMAVSILVRVLVQRWRLLPHALLLDVGAVFLWLGVGNVLSVLLPYNPVSLRARLHARETWKRWLLCQAVPYGLYFVLLPVLHVPYYLIYHGKALGEYRANYLAYSAVYVGIGVAYWLLGLLLATIYARRRRQRLALDLSRDG
jgi:hypothetical protein